MLIVAQCSAIPQQAKAASGKWWPATITRVNPDGTFDVNVQDNTNTTWTQCPSGTVRMDPRVAGAVGVEAKAESGKWWPATPVKILQHTFSRLNVCIAQPRA